MMGKLTGWRGLLAGALVLAGGAAPVPPVADPQLPPKPPFADPQDAIPARQQGMKTNGKIFDAMKKAIGAQEDVKPFAADAHWMVEWGRQVPGMFPKGSEAGHKTRALSEIWSEKAGFDKDAGAFAQAADKLAAAAEANDKAGFAAQFQATGRACGACHKSFRRRED
jgi:cytochrome c556